MRKITFYHVASRKMIVSILALLFVSVQSIFGQVTLTATTGTASGSFTTLSDAFAAINAGTHTGVIAISINASTAEPAAPVYLAASGQGTTSYTSILIKPTATATIAGATTPGSAVINIDGADNVTIDGSIAVGGSTRDLTIQNTALNTVLNVACIRLVGRTTLGLGATNITITNCNITGSTPGNNGLSGSTNTSTYGIYAGSSTLTTMAATTGGADYDNLTINNNFVTNAYIGINVIGLTANQADNFQVTNNFVGSLSNRIGFKGIVGQFLVGGSMTNNVVADIEATTSISPVGIEVGGAATTGFQIRRNTVSNIKSTSTGGWGAYGINILAGTGVVIANNVVTGMLTVNYSISTTFNAFGIRLAGGTGHQVYYNSVNLFGANTTGSTTNAFSAALCVTTTAVTGLDIRNNVFANKMTSTATTPEFFAVNFPAAYNFVNAILDRNAYMVTADAFHFVGKVGTTFGSGNYSNLTAWKTISQVNNTNNDLNSFPGTGNINAPFTSDINLTIPAATVTVLESTGIAIASLGLPNVDRNNVNRPAGTGTNPDIGAYEFEGSQPGDLVAPVVSAVSVTPGSSCTNVSHTVTATVVENIAMGSVSLLYSYGGVAQTPIVMTLTSGTAINGTYSGTIPAASGPNVTVTYSVQATDAATNISAAVSGTQYADNYLVVTASQDVTINTNSPTSISASVNTPTFANSMVKITEVVQFKTGTGSGPYPLYIPTPDNDFIEISNYGSIPLNLGGYTMTAYGAINGSYTIPANVTVAPQATLVLAFAATTNSPADNYYGMGILSTGSTSLNGYVLRNTTGTIVDVVALNGYTFLAASGVTATDWSGNIPTSSAGVRRIAAVDNNLSSDWAISSATNVMNIGVANAEVTGGIAPPQIITWSPSGGTINPLFLAFPNPGVYTYTASYNDGTCTSTDDVVITVIAPVPPVANFSATPLTGSAPLNVAFTDLSTNIPTSWTWTVSPMTGVTFVSSTSSSSQNPIIQFANAGAYTITLLAANIAGFDDSTKIQYINVNMCASNATNTLDTDIGNVTFGSINNGSATPVLSNPGAVNTYTNFTTLPVQTFVLGQTYPISLSQITSGTTFYSAHFNAFIDYNNDGLYDVVTERVFNGATSSTVTSVSGNVTIPTTANTGTVRMRVVLQEGGTATSPACGTYSYGETEDYLINIVCPTATTTTVSSCGSYVWAENGQTYTTSGVYTYAVGTCPPSTLNLTITQNSTATQTVTSCNSYLWSINNTSYTASGSYIDTIPNSVGCDSIITLNLTINQSTSATQTESACSSYTWPLNGNSYSASGSYVDTIANGAGCDSIITLVLTINQPTSSTVTAAACESYTWAQNSTTYTSSGSYVDVILNAAGCDSIVTLDLTINSATSNTVTVSSCGDYTWAQNGTTYTASGAYVDTILNAAGCDSIVTLNLTINTLNLTVTNASPTLTSNEVGATYQWLDCGNGNSIISGATSAVYTATVNGTYSVEVTKNNCTDTSICEIVANIGLKEMADVLNITISPNPTSNFVMVNFENVNSAFVEILDATGKVVIGKSMVQPGDKVDFQNMDRGVYFIRFTSEKGNYIERVVKN